MASIQLDYKVILSIDSKHVLLERIWSIGRCLGVTTPLLQWQYTRWYSSTTLNVDRMMRSISVPYY